MKVKDILLLCSPGGRDRIKELERYGPELAPKPRKSRDPPPPRSHHPPPLVSLDFLRPRPSRSRHSSGSASGGSSSASSSSSSVGIGKSTFYDIDEGRPGTRDRQGPVPSSSTSSEEQSVLENLDNYDLSSLAHAIDSSLKVGDRVVWLRESPQTNEAGIVQWLGIIENEEVAGIDFDNRLDIGSGWYKNQHLFHCAPNHGGLIAVVGLILESELHQHQQNSYLNEFGDEIPTSTRYPSNCPPGSTTIMPSSPFVAPPLGEVDAEGIGGFNKGVQGNNNSCYLDATLFAMFPFNSVFDSILITPYQNSSVSGGDRKLADDVQRILREDIVNPLRTQGFTSGAKVMKLRAAMQHLDGKLISSEMDPAEFLEMLFSAVLHLEGFLTLSSGQSEFFHQVVCTGQAEKVPTVQALLEESLIGQGLKFTGVPSPALILQMPRSGNNFKMFKGLLPNLTIDITDLIQDIPRMCIICGALATEECRDCLGLFNARESNREESENRTPLGSGAFTTSFCQACLHRVHMKPDRKHHLQRVTPISYSFNPDMYFLTPPLAQSTPRTTNGVSASTTAPNYYPASYFSSPPDPTSSYGLPNPTSNSPSSPLYLQPLPSSNTSHQRPLFVTSSKSIPRVTMDLLAVICIEKSHFVSFVKCGKERNAPWVFFDSMADREERIGGTGFNIPKVVVLPQMGRWLHQLEHQPGRLIGCLENPDENPLLKRLISDAYICIYYSREASMYA